ncbi:hypothetical protein VE01_02240 [Pseudogymnoascus verrucosus]|uniref:Thioredoxin-like fold domain-containing protein n=1 Tax=Pseudogymnoascus verrucosus TaxID=342668 RepID=A0A1B8GVH9_9PEZI|nr:uncharacterized protein VE01_02240 [Pseudogymnoascus verrucosus]OBT99852.1 hypothetical protein VE01_02240 [Pseudogymnoascus verrucosus]
MPPSQAPSSTSTSPPKDEQSNSTQQTDTETATLPTRLRTLFTIPAPIRTLFDLVPLHTYAPNPLPTRSPSPSPLPTLHIFTSPSSPTGPSPNPTCLKHQTALRLASLPHTITNSTNHASPTGALPFLLPPTSSPLLPAALLPIGAGQILNYAAKAGHPLPARPSHPKAKVYASLIDDAIRPAFLHAVYLTPANASLPTRLYLAPATSSWLVQTYQGITLRRAAHEQLSIAAPGGVVDIDDIYARAAAAFEALAGALEGEEWVLGGEGGGVTMLDAEMFAYTHLVLEEGMGWGDGRLGREVRRWGALVEHRERVLKRCWGGE